MPEPKDDEKTAVGNQDPDPDKVGGKNDVPDKVGGDAPDAAGGKDDK